jgi:putative transcriptional regulator
MQKTKMGQELIAGLNEAITHVRGSKKLRTTILEIPKPAKSWNKDQIVHLRKQTFKVSQPIFACILSVTVSTVRAWEQGQKSPSGAARRLLEVASIEPEVFQKIAHAKAR